ncbi:phage tail sheath C-terminal domain-containing protein [Streptomyces sp. NPDC005828]|uniref:phage tail sheath family protein n=1 Tax=Streptomyces sp. NPDC005828 TaxID=3157071 RepID=UPI0033F99CDE
MADSVNNPRVYNEELDGFSLAVSAHPTAVPVFIADFGSAFEGVVRVSSWLDLSETAGEAGTGGATGGVLRGYFENGGGYCYLANTAGKTSQQALDLVEAFDDVTILVPLGLWDGGADAAGETARAVTAYAATHRAMAILHAGKDHDAQQARDAARAFKLDAGQSAHAALYHPWLVPAADGAEPLAPVGAVTGLWCKVDSERGVWKAPANVELRGVRPSQTVTDAQQGEAMCVNMLRKFTGGGTVVWGARTLSETDDQWTYIPVRRLVDSVERDLQKALDHTVLQANSQSTWEKIQAATDNYLNGIWQQGGLMGNTPEQAYFVQIGQGVTMTDEDVKAGRIILKVGIAAMRPAEFIILALRGTAGQA